MTAPRDETRTYGPKDTLARVYDAAVGEVLPKSRHMVDETVECCHAGRTDAVSSSAYVGLHPFDDPSVFRDRILDILPHLIHIIFRYHASDDAKAVHIKASESFVQSHAFLPS